MQAAPTTPVKTATNAKRNAPAAKATTAAKTPSTSASLAADPKGEIEEISKKISEHADAIYRTWKSRGLAPAELLEFYASTAETTEAASDLLSATTQVVSAVTAGDDPSSTEGLQKLVNTFVIKDKEQRGVKTKVKAGAALSKPETAQTPATGMTKTATTTVSTPKVLQKNAQIMKQTTKSATPKSAPVIATPTATIVRVKTSGERVGAKNDLVDGLIVRKMAKAASPTPTASPTPIQPIQTATVISTSPATRQLPKINACVKTSENNQQQNELTKASADKPYYQKLEKDVKKSAKGTTNEITASAAGKSLNKTATTTGIRAKSPTTATTASATSTTNFEPMLDINLNLNLDLNDLSQLQTQNLQKIKELLQENADSTKVRKKATSSVKSDDANKKGPVIAASSTGKPGKTVISAATNDATRKVAKSNTKLIETNSQLDANTAPDVVANHAQAKTKTSKPTASDISANSTNSSALISTDITDEISGSIASGASNKRRSCSPTTTKTPVPSATPTPCAKSVQESEPISKSNIAKVAVKSVKSEKSETSEKSLKNQTNSNSKLNKSSTNTSHEASLASSTSSGLSTTTESSTSSVLTSSSAKETIVSDRGAQVPHSATVKKKDNKSLIATASASASSEQLMDTTRSNMPTPTKFKSGRTAISNGPDKNLGRPILTRGSVAERVMMFEKCPDVRASFLNIKRPDPADAPPKSLLKAKLHATPPPPPEQNSLQKEIRSTKSVYIPRFYFPHGKPQPTIALERTLRNILGAFDSFPNNQVTKDELPRILKLCGLPFYWRMPVMVFCQQNNSGLVERQRFVEFWKQMNVYCHEQASRFIYILSRGQRFRSYIIPEDLVPLVQDVVDTHPGLAFLKEATEFHSRYVHTVIARIFYSVNRCWSGKITISELKKSDLLEIISLLEEEDDINQIMAFFSYEHFYVIYCKFWELDKDHDLLISQEDLARHSDHALSSRIVERIFSGCVTRTDNKKNPDDEPKMSYTDFVWFILSEEDKRTPTAIEYWFRCMDVDGDGALSMYELEYFYEEQQHRMESIGIECLPFEDCLCQMLDMIKPARRDCITLGDLKRCKMTHVFFDTFFNLEKYLDHEQRDPFASQRDEYGSDWDRFAAQEYELLITEENE